MTIYTPHVELLKSALDDIQNHLNETTLDICNSYERLIEAEMAFRLRFGKSLYKLKPKRQISSLEQTLGELDSMRSYGLLADPEKIYEEDARLRHIQIIDSFHENFTRYRNQKITNYQNVESNLGLEVPVEHTELILQYLKHDTFRDIYLSTLNKFIDLAGAVAASRWIYDADAREPTRKYWADNPDLAYEEGISPALKREDPSLQWKGSAVELAALFVELQAKGYIDLPGPANFSTPKWETVCRNITGLFCLTTRRESSKGEAWETLSTYFKTKEYAKKGGTVTYSKVEGARGKFRSIISQNPTLDGSK